MSVTIIAEDPRPVSTIAFGPTERDFAYSVGVSGVTLIKPYLEPGEMSFIPWFAVYIGDEMIARVPSRMVMVIYQPPGGLQ